MTSPRLVLLALAAALSSVSAPVSAQSTNLRLTLSGHDHITRNRVRYSCDANAAKLHLPSGPFTVEYIAVGNNGLAMVPIDGERIIFSQVIAASGERFSARDYQWGDKGSEAWLTSERFGPDGKSHSTICHEIH